MEDNPQWKTTYYRDISRLFSAIHPFAVIFLALIENISSLASLNEDEQIVERWVQTPENPTTQPSEKKFIFLL